MTEPATAHVDHLADSADPIVQQFYASLTPLSAPVIEADGEVDRIQSTVEKAADQFEKYLGNIRPDDYSETGLRDRIRKFNDAPVGKALASALEAATNHSNQARAQVDEVLHSLTQEGDAAQESRNNRAWERARRILDNTDNTNVGSAAASLILKARDSELGVLVQELSAYFDSREHARVSSLPDLPTIEGETPDEHAKRSAEAAQVGHIPSYAMAQFKRAVKSRAPQYAQAVERANRAEQARQVIQHNVTSLQKTIADLKHPRGYRRPSIINARDYA